MMYEHAAVTMSEELDTALILMKDVLFRSMEVEICVLKHAHLSTEHILEQTCTHKHGTQTGTDTLLNTTLMQALQRLLLGIFCHRACVGQAVSPSSDAILHRLAAPG
jgi:hypothetical protein